MVYFCGSQLVATKMGTNDDLFPKLVEVLGNDVAEVFENTAKLCYWISRRYYEVKIFRSLQDASNRLKSFSADKLSEIANAILEMLSLGSIEICRAKDSFLVSISMAY
jgi:hypothetical protein